MPNCPPDDDLTGFLDESLPPDRAGGVSAHVDSCPDCQARLDRLTDGAGDVAARYKELSSILDGIPRTLPAGSLPAGGPPPDSSPDAPTRVFGAGGRPALPRLTGLPAVPGFDVLGEIGRGGMGVVYKARHRRLNRLCALKMVLAGGAADPTIVQRFLFEAEVLAQIKHPQVVQVYEADAYLGPSGVPIPYLAMELLEGGTLSRKLKKQEGGSGGTRGGFPPTGSPLAPREAAELIEGLARAVHAAHLQGVVHRDLKPGNILFPGDRGEGSGGSQQHPPPPPQGSGSSLTPAPSPLAAKITDFGLAKFTQDVGSDLTGSGQIVGTPAYMAPEQAAGLRVLGPGADVYSLGAILYECLAGRPPFEGSEPMSVLLKVVNDPPTDVRTLRPDLPRDLAAVTMKCLQKDPRRRYPSAGDLADDLRRFLDNRPTRARPATNVERLWLWVKRNPTESVLLAALAVVIAVGAGGVLDQWTRAERNAADERRARQDAEAAHRDAKEAHRQTAAALDEARTQKAAAEAAQKQTAAALEEAQAQKKLADLREARLEFAQAIDLCEDGQVGRGLGHFARALELAEANDARDLARVVRVNLAAWAADLPPPRRAFPHGPQPKLAAFTPDGKRMVVGGRLSTLYLWDLQTGAKVRTYKAPPLHARSLKLLFTFWSVAVSPDGRTVAAGGSDGQIWVWDVDQESPTAALVATPTADGNVWAVAFAPDGKLWATDGEGGVKLWDLAARKPVASLRSPPDRATVQGLAVSPDGTRVFTGDWGGYLREWDAATGAERRKWFFNGWVTDVAVAPGGDAVAAVGTEGVCRVIDLATGQEVRRVDLAGAYGGGVAFDPDGQTFLVTDMDGTARAWHLKTGQPVGPPVRFAGEMNRPRFRPHSREFAVAAGDAVYLCRAPEPPGLLLNPGNPRRVRGLDFAPAGDRVAVAAGHWLDVYDPRTGGKLLAVDTEHESMAVRFDPDRPRLLRGTRGTLEAVDLAGGARDEADRGVGRLTRLAFAPGGSAAFGHEGDYVYRWDGPDLRRAARVSGAGMGVPPGVEFAALDVRPGGGEVLVSHGPRVVFLDPATLAPARPGWDAPDGVTDARYTPDGKRIFAGLRNNSAVVLDAATGVAVGVPMAHDRAVTAVAVGPAGRTLLTGSRDGTARFWDAATGLPLGPPLRHAGPVVLVAFSPAGDRVATGTANGHALTWKAPPPPVEGTPDEIRAKVRGWAGGADDEPP